MKNGYIYKKVLGRKDTLISNLICVFFWTLALALLSGCGGGGKSTDNNTDTNTSLNLFSTPKNISNTNGDSADPYLLIDTITSSATNPVHVFWAESASGQKGIVSRRSTDGGTSFGNAIMVYQTTGTSSNPKAAIGGGPLIHVAWLNSGPPVSGNEVMYAQSSNGGQSFSLPFGNQTISDIYNGKEVSHFQISEDSEEGVYLSWIENQDLNFSSSGDGGNTFSSPSLISTLSAPPPMDDSEPLLLSAEGTGVANILWQDGSSLKMARSTDGGSNFSFPSFPETGDSGCADRVIDSNKKSYIVWIGAPGTNSQIYFATYTGDSDFSEPVNVSSAPLSSSMCPQIALDTSGNIHVVWEETVGDASDIYYSRSTDGGVTFTAPASKNISNSAGSSEDPRIVADGTDYVNVIWVENVNGKKEIYFSGSKDMGAHFSTPDNLSNTINQDSEAPQMGIDGDGTIYIVWTEGAVGSREIYFAMGKGARNLTDTPVVLSTPGILRPVDYTFSADPPVVQWTPVTGSTKYNLQVATDRIFQNIEVNRTDITSSSFTLSSLPKGLYFLRVRAGDDFDLWSSFSNIRRVYIGLAPTDINGDGYSDLIIGAPGANNGAGKVYIYRGGPSGLTPAITISGETGGDAFGTFVSIAGDVNKDGFCDILVGAPVADGSGKAYLFWGSDTLAGNYSAGQADVVFYGETSGDQFGSALSTGGDVNGDGYADILIGAWKSAGGGAQGFERGRAYLFYGGADVNTSISTALVLSGDVDQGRFGSALDFAGDVNGDGYSDILIGASYTKVGSNANQGKAYLYLGGQETDFIADMESYGEAAGNYFGYSVAGTGDVNKDGFADFVVGAYRAGSNGLTQNGGAYLFLGSETIDSTADLTFHGESSFESFGYAVDSAGDINDDGYDDIQIGAPRAGNNNGRVSIFLGGENMNTTSDVNLTGPSEDSLFGSALSNAGDVDKNGLSDILIGAYTYKATGEYEARGQAYLFYGGWPFNTTPIVTFTGDSSADQFGRSLEKSY